MDDGRIDILLGKAGVQYSSTADYILLSTE